MGDFRDSRVDILARVIVALNTDLEGATAELDMTHRELQNAQARIAQLEAQLAGQQPPEEAEASCPFRSPPRKRLCGMVLGQHRMVGFKVLRSFYANGG
jgi:outer membrane protein TolC